MATATMTSKGQLTIPKEIRDKLGLREGDKVELLLEGDHVTLRLATRDVRALKGLIGKPARPVSLEEMDEAIRTGPSG
jgi:antitoxin PrlF